MDIWSLDAAGLREFYRIGPWRGSPATRLSETAYREKKRPPDRSGGLGSRDQYFEVVDVVQRLPDMPRASTAALAWTMPYP